MNMNKYSLKNIIIATLCPYFTNHISSNIFLQPMMDPIQIYFRLRYGLVKAINNYLMLKIRSQIYLYLPEFFNSNN